MQTNSSSEDLMEKSWNGGIDLENRRGDLEEYPELFLNQGMNFENEIFLGWEGCEDTNFIFLTFILFYRFI